jgi:hypothetical protein
MVTASISIQYHCAGLLFTVWIGFNQGDFCAVYRERAGLALTPDERDLLYKDRGVADNNEPVILMAGAETPASAHSQAVSSPKE